jgi:hypothetical protein
MSINRIFTSIVATERQIDLTALLWNNLDLWPLVRQLLWVELTTFKKHQAHPRKSRLSFEIERFLEQRQKLFAATPIGIKKNAVNTIFLSREVYLQARIENLWIDRIIDPLMTLDSEVMIAEKFYVSGYDWQKRLFISGNPLYKSYCHAPDIPIEVYQVLATIAKGFSLNSESFCAAFLRSLHEFLAWRKTGDKIFSERPHVRQVFLTSWYFPDMMGLTAAARARGIEVIDVQHGKQGRFQAMYSGWTRVPEDSKGYEMMPDRFWCWGERSCSDILEASKDRKIHRPFVGGFPWIDFYKANLSMVASENPCRSSRKVLVTLQPRNTLNPEPIPQFVIDYFGYNSDTRFIFRPHPNDHNAEEYIRERMRNIEGKSYEISDRRSNLYDQFAAVTHHVTAFSSCCYEAMVFGVPTLLFGQSASEIYSEEITSGLFHWTSGKKEDLDRWLEYDSNVGRMRTDYIISSLALAREKLLGGLST